MISTLRDGPGRKDRILQTDLTVPIDIFRCDMREKGNKECEQDKNIRSALSRLHKLYSRSVRK
ncbi:hypothetical protein DENIS_5051 [Desulfonema ishimotonii]|uniref:Uncharacterized protein n=1 Tax=Desulfonema ishimotonii TaxID=45657 RepID=A0A401G498_9BACT|nr:hypothetical protein DENIS_5051 [Desulfonema ishimotonii]